MGSSPEKELEQQQQLHSKGLCRSAAWAKKKLSKWESKALPEEICPALSYTAVNPKFFLPKPKMYLPLASAVPKLLATDMHSGSSKQRLHSCLHLQPVNMYLNLF